LTIPVAQLARLTHANQPHNSEDGLAIPKRFPDMIGIAVYQQLLSPEYSNDINGIFRHLYQFVVIDLGSFNSVRRYSCHSAERGTAARWVSAVYKLNNTTTPQPAGFQPYTNTTTQQHRSPLGFSRIQTQQHRRASIPACPVPRKDRIK
jgi:hypothetical protein